MDCAQRAERRRVFLAGVRDGVPIGLGYLAVAFSLGIAARNAGLNAFQGFLISLLNNASAGEYAAFTVIAADSGFLEMALITLITNARYLLMSCSLSQKFSPDTPLYHRLLVGYDVTDELFGIAIARPGYLDPFYSYGAFLPAIPGWAIGTALGVTAGSILPARLVSALSVALFGMFLAIIIPPSKKNPVVLGCVAVSFAASWLCTVLPYVKTLSEGTRTILLTILIASAAALLFPVKDGPLYACTFDPVLGETMVTMGGIITDGEQNALDANYEPIPGLYMAGNDCGRRFGTEYVTPIPGCSLAFALVLGRECGKSVAKFLG